MPQHIDDNAMLFGDLLVTDENGNAYMLNFSDAVLVRAEPVKQPKRFDADGLLELLE